jgi:D-alanine-D-alanine ligase
MSKIRVGVLRGGPSSEYEVSLNSGNTVLNNLSANKYEIYDIFINKDGLWHFRGRERMPVEILSQMDVAFLALHGEFGEDGGVQRLLDRFSIPYTGSKAFSSSVCMNKAETKKNLRELGILMPKDRVIRVGTDLRDQIHDVMRSFAFPLIVKPVRAGSSVGITLALNDEMLLEGIRKAFNFGAQVLVEEYLEGREATCGVIEDFRGEKIYSLLPVEIIPQNKDKLFDYDAKYGGGTKEMCPGNFTRNESLELQKVAREVHKKMGLSHYSRSDFIITDKGIYFLEVNTLPGLTEESLLPKSINAIGASLPDFLDHIITLARR